MMLNIVKIVLNYQFAYFLFHSIQHCIRASFKNQGGITIAHVTLAEIEMFNVQNNISSPDYGIISDPSLAKHFPS